MIKPQDIVLTRRDKLKILCHILNDMVPWQIPAVMAVLMTLTSCFLINNFDWYQNIPYWRHAARFIVCIPLSFVELCAFVAIFSPIEEKITARWSKFEERYRKDAVKKLDEFLLSQRAAQNTDDDCEA